jgi:hypothetical protein
VGNGISVYQRLDDGYLVTQRGGPHVIFGRGNACLDDLVTAFLVGSQVPEQRETECAGVVADEYVPLAPPNASAFESPRDALASAETEITYLPEYYYWDGVEPTSAGCTSGGTLGFEPDGAKHTFTLRVCTFARNFTLTGTGSYHPDRDRFVWEVTLTGRWQCDLQYVRTGDTTKVTGLCDGKAMGWDK